MKHISLLFGLTAILGLSCKKQSILGHPNSFITNPTSYILKHQTWTGPTSNGESFSYFYNSENLISRIERYQWGGGGTSQMWYDTSYYQFEYNNGLCTKWTINDGFQGYFIYKYNDQKLPLSRTIYYSDSTIQGHTFYKYDNSGNLIEKIDSSNKVNFRNFYTYDSGNNLTSATENILWSSPQQKLKTEYVTFDTKVNYIKAVNGLPMTTDFDNNFHSYSTTSPNNFASSKYYTQVNINDPFGSPQIVTLTYEYNDEGLPTKMQSGPWTVIYEYAKYK